MSKVNESDRQKLIKDLKSYEENFCYLAKMEKGETDTHYSEESIKNFSMLLSQLKDYIADIENGLEMYNSFGDWCDLFVDALLDDDNFWYEEDGFSWH